MKLIRRLTQTISIAFLLSILLHGVIALVLVYENVDALKKLTEAKPKTSEVELLDAEKFLQAVKNAKKIQSVPEGQVVQQDEKQLNDEITDTRFLSAHNQRVKQQTQAQVNGQFKNSDDTGGEKKAEKVAGKMKDAADEKREAREEQKPEKAQHEMITDENGVPTELSKKSSKMKAFMPSFRPTAPMLNAATDASGGGEGPSATDDHLKDVKTGMQTLLSTREFLYYSYYNRIRSKLSQYWQPKIREKMEKIMKQGRTIASTGDKITRIVIILDDKGILRRVQVLGTAGVTDLDDAAVEAFKAAAPFPNPPKGMVDGEGEIKIRWDFVLEA